MVSVNSMMKAKAYNMYIVPESAYCSCSAALFVTDRAALQSMLQSKPASMDFDLRLYAVLVCRLSSPLSLVHINTWITTHLPTL